MTDRTPASKPRGLARQRHIAATKDNPDYTVRRDNACKAAHKQAALEKA